MLQLYEPQYPVKSSVYEKYAQSEWEPNGILLWPTHTLSYIPANLVSRKLFGFSHCELFFVVFNLF